MKVEIRGIHFRTTDGLASRPQLLAQRLAGRTYNIRQGDNPYMSADYLAMRVPQQISVSLLETDTALIPRLVGLSEVTLEDLDFRHNFSDSGPESVASMRSWDNLKGTVAYTTALIRFPDGSTKTAWDISGTHTYNYKEGELPEGCQLAIDVRKALELGELIDETVVTDQVVATASAPSSPSTSLPSIKIKGFSGYYPQYDAKDGPINSSPVSLRVTGVVIIQADGTEKIIDFSELDRMITDGLIPRNLDRSTLNKYGEKADSIWTALQRNGWIDSNGAVLSKIHRLEESWHFSLVLDETRIIETMLSNDEANRLYYDLIEASRQSFV